MNQDEILKNKAAIVSASIFEYRMERKNELGIENTDHYLRIIKSFETSLKDEVANWGYLEDEVKDLKFFIFQLSKMLRKSVEVFDYSYRYNQENKHLANNFFNAKIDLVFQLDKMSEFVSIIKYYERKGDYLIVMKMKDFCFDNYCSSIEILRKVLCVDVSKSSLNVNYKQLKKALKKSTSAKKILLLKELDLSTTQTTEAIELKNSEDYKKLTWFKVGLKFATGEAQLQYSKHQNYTRLASDLGFKKTDRPYFSESFSSVSLDSKNLFSSPIKINLICKHCKENNIDLSPEFLKMIPEVME